MINFLMKMNSILDNKDKIKLFYLLLFSIFIACIETIGISIIMPYIKLANDFTLIESNTYYKYISELFVLDSSLDFVILMGVVIICFYIFRALVNAIYVYKIMSFVQDSYYKIVNKLFHNYLKMPYKDFINCNSSSLTKVIITEALYISDIFRASLILASELLVFLFIYTILLSINYQIALVITLIILVVGFLILKTISVIMKKKGVEREKEQKVFYEILNKNFNNIKMLKLQSLNNSTNDFNITSREYTNINKISNSFLQFPRLILEAVGFSIVVLIIVFLLIKNNSDISSNLGIITIFVLGLYRLLPSTTRILASYNQILFFYKSLDIIFNDYHIIMEDIGNEKFKF